MLFFSKMYFPRLETGWPSASVGSTAGFCAGRNNNENVNEERKAQNVPRFLKKHDFFLSKESKPFSRKIFFKVKIITHFDRNLKMKGVHREIFLIFFNKLELLQLPQKLED